MFCNFWNIVSLKKLTSPTSRGGGGAFEMKKGWRILPRVYSQWKDRSNFLPPKSDLFVIDYQHHDHSGHLGGSRGSFGCSRGSAPTKYAIIFQGLVKALEWIVLAYNNYVHYVFKVLGQNGLLGTKKRPFWAQIGYAKSGFFSKTSS